MLQYVGFPGGSVVKNLPASAGDTGSILGEGNDNPLQYSCLENPLDRGAWCASAPGVIKESDIGYNLAIKQQQPHCVFPKNKDILFQSHSTLSNFKKFNIDADVLSNLLSRR